MGYALITLFVIMTLNFIIFRIMPGDPCLAGFEPGVHPGSEADCCGRMYGLDKPLWTQYFLYMKNMLAFDFGRSFVTPTGLR